MAFANAFLGICHSMAHKLGAAFHLPHGLANAALISHVIRYNATDMPFKQAAFPQYQFPQAKERYGEEARGPLLARRARLAAPRPCGASLLRARWWTNARPSLTVAPPSCVRAAELSDMLGLGGKSEDDKVIKLIEAVEALKAEVDIQPTIKEMLGADKEAEYLGALDRLAEDAFDDQCTGANPRYPLIADLKAILTDAWKAPVLPLKDLTFISKSS